VKDFGVRHQYFLAASVYDFCRKRCMKADDVKMNFLAGTFIEDYRQGTGQHVTSASKFMKN